MDLNAAYTTHHGGLKLVVFHVCAVTKKNDGWHEMSQNDKEWQGWLRMTKNDRDSDNVVILSPLFKSIEDLS